MAAPDSHKNRNLALSLFALVAGMVMLSFAAVPLYDLFCRVTGFGGTTQVADSLPDKVYDRRFTVSFNADTNPDLPWEFGPNQREVSVRVGEQMLVSYHARNTARIPVAGRAIYNVSPPTAGAYFNKIACFCFEKQLLQPGQEVQMPVSFFLDPEIMEDPDLKDVQNITLSYTFFPYKDDATR